MEDNFYQNMVRYLRNRVNQGDPRHWPGKPLYAHAAGRYPNIAAELYGSIHYPPFEYVEEYAGVSREIVAAVIEDNEELSAVELCRLGRKWGHGPVGYLACPILQIIDPATNKGKRRWMELKSLLDTSVDLDPLLQEMAATLLDRMKSGEVITFAEWRCVYQEIQEDREWKRLQEMQRRCVRTSRYPRRNQGGES